MPNYVRNSQTLEASCRPEPGMDSAGTGLQDGAKKFPSNGGFARSCGGPLRLSKQFQKRTDHIVPWAFYRDGSLIRDVKNLYVT